MATYRLVAIGQDGRSATSPTLDIYRAQDFAVEVYSNPVQLPSPLAIKLVLNETSMIKATLSDPQGRIVSQVRETFFAGEHQLKLPTAKLAAGSYVLSVSGGESQVVKRVMLY
jgi:lipase chaperone LimK